MTAMQRFGTPLSEREIKAISLAAQGMTNAEIGKQMYLSMETAKSHLYSATQKLGARNRTHMVAIALRHGVIT